MKEPEAESYILGEGRRRPVTCELHSNPAMSCSQLEDHMFANSALDYLAVQDNGIMTMEY